MRKKDVIDFFDRLAPRWDADLIRHGDAISVMMRKYLDVTVKISDDRMCQVTGVAR